jgi:hypothetical protein
MHRGIRVSWSAARFERRGRKWMSIRELSAERDRWAVRARCDRGFTRQLPDFAVWVEAHELPCAVVVESGRRRDDRQKMILEGWRDAIHNGRYAHVQYDCTNPSIAHRINQLAKTAGLSEPTFSAIVQPTATEITALPPAASDDRLLPATLTRVDHDTELPAPEPAATRRHLRLVEDPAPAPPPREPTSVTTAARQPEEPKPCAEEPETAEQHERRRQQYYEIFGSYDSFGPPEKSKRRWRRR